MDTGWIISSFFLFEYVFIWTLCIWTHLNAYSLRLSVYMPRQKYASHKFPQLHMIWVYWLILSLYLLSLRMNVVFLVTHEVIPWWRVYVLISSQVKLLYPTFLLRIRDDISMFCWKLWPWALRKWRLITLLIIGVDMDIKWFFTQEMQKGMLPKFSQIPNHFTHVRSKRILTKKTPKFNYIECMWRWRSKM